MRATNLFTRLGAFVGRGPRGERVRGGAGQEGGPVRSHGGGGQAAEGVGPGSPGPRQLGRGHAEAGHTGRSGTVPAQSNSNIPRWPPRRKNERVG
eukprot:1176743-Prorocentrum_minimum.AAC.1